MTSKISFSNIIKSALKNRLWGIAISSIVLFFSLPIYAAAYIANIRYQYIDGTQTYLFPRLFRYNVLCENNIALLVFVPLLAIFLAINSFSYLFVKSKCDLYHSLPIKRDELFKSNYLSGILAFEIPFAAFFVLAIIIGAINGFLGVSDLGIAIWGFILRSVGFVLVYTVAVFAVMLTGNMNVALLGIAVLHLYGCAADAILEMYKSSFFSTYYPGYSSAIISWFSPVYIYGRVITQNSFTKTPGINIVLLLITIVLSLAIAAGSMYVYKIRPIEGAGTAIVFKKLRGFLSVMMLIPASMLGAMFFASITSFARTYNHAKDATFYGWFLFGLIVTIIVGHFIIQAIYYLDIKSLTKNLVNPLIALCSSLVLTSLFMFDITGFDSYAPGEDVTSVAISCYGWQNGQDYLNFDAEEDENGYRPIWLDNETYRLENMKITEKEAYVSFLAKCRELNKEYDKLVEADTEIEGGKYTEVCVKFEKSNGKTSYRTYDVDMEALMDEYAKIYATAGYKDTVYSILTDNTDLREDVLYFKDSIGEQVLFDENNAERKAFIDTYREELRATTAKTLCDEIPIGFIYFEKQVPMNGYNESYNYDIGYVYPSYEKTLALLEKYDIDIYRYKDVDNILGIEITDYHYDVADAVEMENADTTEYTDPEQIVEILDKTVPYEFSTTDDLFHTMENLDVVVTYKEVPAGCSKTINLAFPKGVSL